MTLFQLHNHKGNFLRDQESQKFMQLEFCQYVIQSWCQMTQKVCLNSYVQHNVLNDDQKIFLKRNADFVTILPPQPWQKLEIHSIRMIHIERISDFCHGCGDKIVKKWAFLVWYI